MIEALSWKLQLEASKLKDMKMVCANSLNAKRYQAKKVQRHKPGSGTDVIMSLDEFSKPDRKLNHSPYGKRECMKVIRRKKLKKDIFLKKQNKTKPKHNLKLYIELSVCTETLMVLKHA